MRGLFNSIANRIEPTLSPQAERELALDQAEADEAYRVRMEEEIAWAEHERTRLTGPSHDYFQDYGCSIE